ncbi:hypothetical protein Droror1_Dr00015891, partial [Drosera rotundifolia]
MEEAKERTREKMEDSTLDERGDRYEHDHDKTPAERAYDEKIQAKEADDATRHDDERKWRSPAADPTRVVQINISQDLLYLVLVVSFAKYTNQILSSNVAGFIYITDVDIQRRKITYLTPSLVNSQVGCVYMEVGLIAVNDVVILRNHNPWIIKRHFREKNYYVELLDLFNEVEFQIASGQLIDLIITIEGEKDLSKYSLPVHRRIVQYKTAYYSFYLPVACALVMSGEKLDDHVKNILIDMGIYFQVQDDFLDCFRDPAVIGKIGTDIEDFKCSWLVVKALEISNGEQKKLLY